MKSLLRLLRRPLGEQRLVIEATLLLTAVRPALAVLPFPVLRRGLRVASGWVRGGAASPQQVAWAVEAVGRRLPWASSCLVQALAAESLLNRYGCPARLRIGVSKETSALLAHAWVECGDLVVVGGGDLARYVSLEDPAVRPSAWAGTELTPPYNRVIMATATKVAYPHIVKMRATAAVSPRSTIPAFA